MGARRVHPLGVVPETTVGCWQSTEVLESYLSFFLTQYRSLSLFLAIGKHSLSLKKMRLFAMCSSQISYSLFPCSKLQIPSRRRLAGLSRCTRWKRSTNIAWLLKIDTDGVSARVHRRAPATRHAHHIIAPIQSIWGISYYYSRQFQQSFVPCGNKQFDKNSWPRRNSRRWEKNFMLNICLFWLIWITSLKKGFKKLMVCKDLFGFTVHVIFATAKRSLSNLKLLKEQLA